MKEQSWKLRVLLPNEENQRVIEEYLLSLKLANRSKNTLNAYRYFLETFFQERKESFRELSSDTILSWFERHQKHIGKETFRVRLRILSLFYDFCLKEELIDNSPIKRRWFPRLSKPIPKYLEKQELAKLRITLEKQPLRNRALVEFMLSSGCRVSEVHTLNREDVNLENRSARVKGKGGKIRNVHFTDRCALLLERYMESVSNTSSSALFVSFTTGKRLSVRRMRDVISDIGDIARINKNLFPHRFRHTFATELLAKGAELTFISSELGHSKSGTTRIYAQIPNREIIAMYRKYKG